MTTFSTLQKFTPLRDPVETSFIGVKIESDEKRALVYLQCKFKRRFTELNDEFTKMKEEGNYNPEELNRLINGIAETIAEEARDKKRFLIARCPHTEHYFQYPGAGHRIRVRQDLNPREMQLFSIFYYSLGRMESPYKSIDAFTKAIEGLSNLREFKFQIRFISEINFETSVGYVV